MVREYFRWVLIVLQTASICRSGRVIRVTTNGDQTKSVFLNDRGVEVIGQRSLIMDVKACAEAVVQLTQTQRRSTGDFFEVYLGSQENSLSIIRFSGIKKKATVRGSFLDCKNFRTFWFSWEDEGTLKVGRGSVIGVSRFLSLETERKVEVHYIIVYTGMGNEGEWKILKDSRPEFVHPYRDGSTVLQVREDTPVRGAVYELKAQDPDNDDIVYRVTGQNADVFGVSGNHLILLKRLDFEMKQNYVVTISASDGRHEVRQSMMVAVIDLVDEVPVIGPPMMTSILEELPVGTPIGHLATVIDRDKDAKLKYSLTGRDSQFFNMDPRTGEIRMRKRLDRDKQNGRRVLDQLTLTVDDQIHLQEKKLHIVVVDINDNPPMFGQSIYRVAVRENMFRDTLIANLTCEDIDDGANSVFTLVISSVDATTTAPPPSEENPSVPAGNLPSVLPPTSTPDPRGVAAFGHSDGDRMSGAVSGERGSSDRVKEGVVDRLFDEENSTRKEGTRGGPRVDGRNPDAGTVGRNVRSTSGQEFPDEGTRREVFRDDYQQTHLGHTPSTKYQDDREASRYVQGMGGYAHATGGYGREILSTRGSLNTYDVNQNERDGNRISGYNRRRKYIGRRGEGRYPGVYDSWRNARRRPNYDDDYDGGDDDYIYDDHYRNRGRYRRPGRRNYWMNRTNERETSGYMRGSGWLQNRDDHLETTTGYIRLPDNWGELLHKKDSRADMTTTQDVDDSNSGFIVPVKGVDFPDDSSKDYDFDNTSEMERSTLRMEHSTEGSPSDPPNIITKADQERLKENLRLAVDVSHQETSTQRGQIPNSLTPGEASDNENETMNLTTNDNHAGVLVDLTETDTEAELVTESTLTPDLNSTDSDEDMASMMWLDSGRTRADVFFDYGTEATNRQVPDSSTLPFISQQSSSDSSKATSIEDASPDSTDALAADVLTTDGVTIDVLTTDGVTTTMAALVSTVSSGSVDDSDVLDTLFNSNDDGNSNGSRDDNNEDNNKDIVTTESEDIYRSYPSASRNDAFYTSKSDTSTSLPGQVYTSRTGTSTSLQDDLVTSATVTTISPMTTDSTIKAPSVIKNPFFTDPNSGYSGTKHHIGKLVSTTGAPSRNKNPTQNDRNPSLTNKVLVRVKRRSFKLKQSKSDSRHYVLPDHFWPTDAALKVLGELFSDAEEERRRRRRQRRRRQRRNKWRKSVSSFLRRIASSHFNFATSPTGYSADPTKGNNDPDLNSDPLYTNQIPDVSWQSDPASYDDLQIDTVYPSSKEGRKLESFFKHLSIKSLQQDSTSHTPAASGGAADSDQRLASNDWHQRKAHLPKEQFTDWDQYADPAIKPYRDIAELNDYHENRAHVEENEPFPDSLRYSTYMGGKDTMYPSLPWDVYQMFPAMNQDHPKPYGSPENKDRNLFNQKMQRPLWLYSPRLYKIRQTAAAKPRYYYKGRQLEVRPTYNGRQPIESPVYKGRQPKVPTYNGRQPKEMPVYKGRQPKVRPTYNGRQPKERPVYKGRQPKVRPIYKLRQSKVKPIYKERQPNPMHIYKGAQSRPIHSYLELPFQLNDAKGRQPNVQTPQVENGPHDDVASNGIYAFPSLDVVDVDQPDSLSARARIYEELGIEPQKSWSNYDAANADLSEGEKEYASGEMAPSRPTVEEVSGHDSRQKGFHYNSMQDRYSKFTDAKQEHSSKSDIPLVRHYQSSAASYVSDHNDDVEDSQQGINIVDFVSPPLSSLTKLHIETDPERDNIPMNDYVLVPKTAFAKNLASGGRSENSHGTSLGDGKHTNIEDKYRLQFDNVVSKRGEEDQPGQGQSSLSREDGGGSAYVFASLSKGKNRQDKQSHVPPPYAYDFESKAVDKRDLLKFLLDRGSRDKPQSEYLERQSEYLKGQHKVFHRYSDRNDEIKENYGQGRDESKHDAISELRERLRKALDKTAREPRKIPVYSTPYSSKERLREVLDANSRESGKRQAHETTYSSLLQESRSVESIVERGAKPHDEQSSQRDSFRDNPQNLLNVQNFPNPQNLPNPHNLPNPQNLLHPQNLPQNLPHPQNLPNPQNLPHPQNLPIPIAMPQNPRNLPKRDATSATKPVFEARGLAIWANSKSVDYDSMPDGDHTFTLTVLAIDRPEYGRPLTGTTLVLVQVLPVNEFRPRWEDPQIDSAGWFPSLLAPENITVGTAIIKFKATDDDAGEDGRISYFLSKVTDARGREANEFFLIDQSTGVMKTAAKLDRDPNTGGVTHFDLVITATDNGDPSMSDEGHIRISLADVNDNAPVFGRQLYEVVLPRTWNELSSWKMQLDVNDHDRKADFRFKIIKGDTDKFSMEETTGVITLRGTPDKTLPYKVLTVTVSDGGDPELTSTAQVIIHTQEYSFEHVRDAIDARTKQKGPWAFKMLSGVFGFILLFIIIFYVCKKYGYIFSSAVRPDGDRLDDEVSVHEGTRTRVINIAPPPDVTNRAVNSGVERHEPSYGNIGRQKGVTSLRSVNEGHDRHVEDGITSMGPAFTGLKVQRHGER